MVVLDGVTEARQAPVTRRRTRLSANSNCPVGTAFHASELSVKKNGRASIGLCIY